MQSLAIRFIFLLGIVSLFADITYEGARGIIGPYLLMLGASGAAVGFATGIGEFFGYILRGVFGWVTDRTKQYWPLTFLGYGLNLIAVPLLALATNWQIAACFIILERIGKAIRIPARDAMLSFATKQVGRGWGFGLHESLDRIGAFFGPFAMAAILYYHQSYRKGFATLAIPALLALIVLFLTKRSFPSPEHLETKISFNPKGLSSQYWIYLIGTGCLSLGFTNFAIIAYHLNKTSVFTAAIIPLLYAMANAIAGASSLVFGKIYDRKGISFLVLITALVAPCTLLLFLESPFLAILGMILFGIGYATQSSLLRAVIAHLVAPEQRGSAYGLLNLTLGFGGAIGSYAMGAFYDISRTILIVFSLATQGFAVFLFSRLARQTKY